MKLTPVCVLTTLILTVGSATANAPSEFSFEGVARDSQGSVIYHEHHRVTGDCDDGWWRPREQTVEYIRPGEKEPFASKVLAYTADLKSPEVDFRQPDFGERLTVAYQDNDSLRVRWLRDEAEEVVSSIVSSSDLVVDAGFDHLVRGRWRTLLEGDPVSFSFLAPTRGETYDFILDSAGEALEGTEHSFRIRPAGLLTRMLVDPIQLGYDKDGFLIRYSGLGNIRRNKDENYVIDIHYSRSVEPDCPILP